MSCIEACKLLLEAGVVGHQLVELGQARRIYRALAAQPRQRVLAAQPVEPFAHASRLLSKRPHLLCARSPLAPRIFAAEVETGMQLPSERVPQSKEA